MQKKILPSIPRSNFRDFRCFRLFRCFLFNGHETNAGAPTEGFPSSLVVFQSTGGVAKGFPSNAIRKKHGPQIQNQIPRFP
jgi:hypothetical protein